MKKQLGLFFSGIFALSVGIGFLYTAFNHSDVQKAKAGSNISYVKFDDKGVFKLGSYPQDIVTSISADEIINSGSLKETELGTKYYIYQSKKYAIIENAVVDTENSAGRMLSNGEAVNNYNNQSNVVIEFKDIEWQLLKKEKTGDYAYLISTNILDRQLYNETESNNLPYENSYLYNFLNKSFKTIAFNDDDYKYIAYANEGIEKVFINIPERNDVDLDTYQDANLKQASDYAILNNLSSHSAVNHGVGTPYLNAGYWLKTASYESDRMQVCWSKVAVSNCLYTDPKIGVRPVILVNYKEASGGGGGGTTPSSNHSSNGGNATLGIGIAFSIIGAGGLIVFFILWAKKHPSGKPPIWIIISVAGSLVVSVVGLGCLAGGMFGGGASCFNYGYYVLDTQHSGGGIVQVGYTAWLIKSDGTASYCSHITDATSASDFSPDNYMTGTYKINGSKLVIEIPKHTINNFGTVGGTYTYTINGCRNFKNYADAFHWVRGE